MILRLLWLKYPETDLIVLMKQSDSTYGRWPIQNQPESSHFLTAYNREKVRKEVIYNKIIKCRFATRQDGNA